MDGVQPVADIATTRARGDHVKRFRATTVSCVLGALAAFVLLIPSGGGSLDRAETI